MEVSTSVLYAGKVVVLPHESEEVRLLIRRFEEVENSVSGFAQRSEAWKKLYTRLSTISMLTLTAKIEYRYYQFILLNDVVLPYLSKMTSRLSLSASRFRQMNQLLDIATSSMSCALALQQVDALRNEVYLEGSFWRSELGAALANTSTSLWQPIIQDYRYSQYNCSM